jgi:hypothetical protein
LAKEGKKEARNENEHEKAKPNTAQSETKRQGSGFPHACPVGRLKIRGNDKNGKPKARTKMKKQTQNRLVLTATEKLNKNQHVILRSPFLRTRKNLNQKSQAARLIRFFTSPLRGSVQNDSRGFGVWVLGPTGINPSLALNQRHPV